MDIALATHCEKHDNPTFKEFWISQTELLSDLSKVVGGVALLKVKRTVKMKSKGIVREEVDFGDFSFSFY
jgi:hypothetical protein